MHISSLEVRTRDFEQAKALEVAGWKFRRRMLARNSEATWVYFWPHEDRWPADPFEGSHGAEAQAQTCGWSRRPGTDPNACPHFPGCECVGWVWPCAQPRAIVAVHGSSKPGATHATGGRRTPSTPAQMR